MDTKAVSRKRVVFRNGWELSQRSSSARDPKGDPPRDSEAKLFTDTVIQNAAKAV